MASVEYTDQFDDWFQRLSEGEQDDVIASVSLLQEFGPALPYPHSSAIKHSRHSHMRELRIQHAGKPYRVFYAFDPRRAAILLIGGSKAGDSRFYDRMIPVADKLYDEHLDEIRRESK